MNCRVSQTCVSLSSWTTSRASPRTSSSNWPSGRTWAVAHTTPAHPPFSYFVHVPTSLSLIGPSQLVQCLASVQISNLTHGEPRSRIAGATGPSQGLVSAVAISASHSFDSTLPMSSELRSASESVVFVVERHSQFSPSSLEFATAKGDEGTSSPMLDVGGLAFSTFEAQAKKTNHHLPANSQLSISLFNGPNINVVTGPARHSTVSLPSSGRSVP